MLARNAATVAFSLAFCWAWRRTRSIPAIFSLSSLSSIMAHCGCHRALVARQLGRDPRTFRRVVVRCPFGGPAVTEQEPYDSEGEPFPTTYYVTCRHLVAAISRLEAAGGVERWTRAAEDEPDLAASRAAADGEQRAVRREAGSGNDRSRRRRLARPRRRRRGSHGSLKCLHAHAAFALARPGYVLGELIVGELDPLWPDECCTPLASAADAD